MMKIRAVICDIYRTLLDVGRAPDDAGERWEQLCDRELGVSCPCSLAALSDRCHQVVSADHAAAKARGIVYPEVNWESVMVRALPCVGALDSRRRRGFLVEHISLLREVRLMPGAAAFLRLCCEYRLPLGIVSNAQPYTLDELALALAGCKLSLDVFDRRLCFWSFENGFSKPDPYVFQILSARMGLIGITPSEGLVVGDRQDNDIVPAQAAGFRTWWFRDDAEAGDGAGGWQALCSAIFGARPFGLSTSAAIGDK